ncbi:MAG: ribosome silencing factor [Planctomycetia bacterium]|nr:ribosome silencing factor [Planctomycetia bacterium]
MTDSTHDPMNMPTIILPRDGAESLKRAKMAAQVIADNRGKEIVILDLRKLTYAFDYFVIATGASNRQLHAMSDAVDELLEKEMKEKKLSTEGYQNSRWILCDYGDVVIHLFDEDTREYFRLEDLWGGADRVEFTPSVIE